METLIHADIFFFIVTIIVVIFAIVGLVVVFYVVRILHSVRYIANKIKEESEHVSDDIAELRGRIKEGGVRFSAIIRTLASFFIGKAVASRKRKKSDKQSDNSVN